MRDRRLVSEQLFGHRSGLRRAATFLLVPSLFGQWKFLEIIIFCVDFVCAAPADTGKRAHFYMYTHAGTHIRTR